MSGIATNEINIIFNSRWKNKSHIQQKAFAFSFYYIQPYQQRGTYVHCTFFKLSLFLALSLDNEHERTLKGFLIQFKFWCYKIIQRHASSDFIGVYDVT